MRLKFTEFRDYGNVSLLSDTESGLCIVEYSKIEGVKLAEHNQPRIKESFYCNEVTVEINIKEPWPRDVLRIAIVQRTSHNAYKATYSDKIGCAQCTAKNYDEIHAFLKPLWGRQLDKRE